MTLEYSTILMVALKAVPCLDLSDEACRRFARDQEAACHNSNDLMNALTPFVEKLYGEDQLDEGERDIHASFFLWNAVDYILSTQRDGIGILGCLDAQYPKELLDLEDFPVLLYVKGDASILADPNRVAIVGTREPSEYGKKVSRRLGAYYTEKGFIIVSGLAKGCDTEAHWGCIEASGKTIAVLAHGLDIVYPEENAGLAESIIANGGCLVSEYIPPDGPTKESFIERDRIQAALAKGVIVVESEVGGGTMHTARCALQLGRKLGCMGYDREVPEAKMAGNDELVKEGKAVRLVDAEDLDKFIGIEDR